MTVEIIQNGNNLLREISKDIPLKNITDSHIQKVILDMNEALNGQYDGVAIAAPQIGITLRIFIISGKVFDDEFLFGDKKSYHIKKNKKSIPNMVFINPIIKKISRDRKLMDEGCLSVRPIYGKVRRATRATIEAYNEKGEKFTMNGSGLLAHIFQHETDHLDGILFIDKAKSIREEPEWQNK